MHLTTLFLSIVKSLLTAVVLVFLSVVCLLLLLVEQIYLQVRLNYLFSSVRQTVNFYSCAGLTEIYFTRRDSCRIYVF